MWIRDLPFVLDTLKDVTSILPPDSCMTTVDGKSGYDHILLSENSRKYFGIQFAGWFFVYNTLPFGFKASAYVYQTTGLLATGFVFEQLFKLTNRIDRESTLHSMQHPC